MAVPQLSKSENKLRLIYSRAGPIMSLVTIESPRPKTTLSRRVALDANKYSHLTEYHQKQELLERLGIDLAAVTQEMAPRKRDNKEREPITPFELNVNFTKQEVTSPQFSLQRLESHTDETDQTGLATKKIIEHLLNPTHYNDSQQILIVWISPPGNDANGIHYTESRYNVYFGQRSADKNTAYIRCYGGLATSHNIKECLTNGNFLNNYASNPQEFSTDSQLRTHPLVIDLPENTHPLEFLKDLQLTIPQEVWNRILTGQTEEEYQTALKHTQEIARLFVPALLRAKTDLERTFIMARIEQTLMATGYKLVPSSGGHGGLNLESIPTITISGERHWFVKNCGACKAPLNKWMKKHDKCPCCQGIYEGC